MPPVTNIEETSTRRPWIAPLPIPVPRLDASDTIMIGHTISFAESKMTALWKATSHARLGLQDTIVKTFGSRGPAIVSEHLVREILALKRLTQAGCPHLPQYLVDVVSTSNPPDVEHTDPNFEPFVEHYVVTTKVRGRPLQDFSYGELMQHHVSLKRALDQMYASLWASGVRRGKISLRNIVYNVHQNRCYVVNFDDWESREKLHYEFDTWSPESSVYGD
ncbi:hypothetical protein CBER1_08733 [Cercospora berteroae]|uniref:Fungal-type protein kinase domain-containing protein n=1 Tax=Cercospora berteroae TaxID=357750 RepID=A0A2S6CAC6_9PEZI|nr:hypothetical protein CBER1_08733 [Cercospora berteroae]